MPKCVSIALVVALLQVLTSADQIDHLGSQQAAQHFARVLHEAKCERPVPRVVYLSRLYPTVNKKYVPSATQLFVCDSSAGCCSDEAERCLAKSAQEVTLHFFTVELTDKGKKKSVEAVKFFNHTQCHCKRINSPEDIEIYQDNTGAQNMSQDMPPQMSRKDLALSNNASFTTIIITLLNLSIIGLS